MTPSMLFQIMLLQLFWFSFAAIGLAVLWLLRRRVASRFWRFFEETHWIVQLLISLSCGMVVFAPVLVLGVVLALPVKLLSVCYLIALVGSIGVLISNRSEFRALFRDQWPKKISLKTLLVGIVIALILLIDYAVSLKIGPPLFGDAIVHNAKIQQLSEGNFTLADPVFGNGVIESRYHINLPLSLHALANQLLPLKTVAVWIYSMAFWRFFLWLALFSLAWVFLERVTHQRRWSYAVLAIAPLFYSATFFFASYPGRIVYIWTIIFLIGLRLLYRQRDALLLMSGAVLIALTHPINSLAAAVFLVGYTVLVFLLKQLTRRQAMVLAAATVCLLTPAILSLAFPNRMTPTAFGLEPILVRRHGPILLGLPARIPKVWDPWLVTLLSLVGYGYLYAKASAKSHKALIALIVFFYALIVYNPIVLEIIHGRLPVWVISRFQELNLFGFVAPIIGLLAIVELIRRRISPRLSASALTSAVFIVVSLYSLFGLRTVQAFTSFHAEYTQSYQRLQQMQELRPELDGQRAFADNTFTQPWLPAVADTRIINIAETHASPMSNMLLRWPCAVRLREALDLHDLRAAGVTRVVTNSEIDPHLAGLAASNAWLVPLKQVGPFIVYEVSSDIPTFQPLEFSTCSIPYGQ